MEPAKKKGTARPLLYLLLIPGAILLDIIIFIIAVFVDINLYPEETYTEGHPLPAFVIIAFILMVVILICAIVLAIILTVKGFAKNRKEYAAPSAENQKKYKNGKYTEGQMKKILSKGYAQRPLFFLIMLAVQIGLDILLVCGGFAIDQANYSPPPFGGFMFPVTMFFGLGIAFIMTAIVTPVSLVLTFKNMSRRRRQVAEAKEIMESGCLDKPHDIS